MLTMTKVLKEAYVESGRHRYYVRDRQGFYWSRSNGWVKKQKLAAIVTGTTAAAWKFVDEVVDEDDEGVYLEPI